MPWGRIIGIGALGIAFVLLVVVILSGTLDEPNGGVPEGTREVATDEPRHVDGNIYGPNDVPAGGPHAPIWANCGYYSSPVEAENAVHALEHGAVWITYRPDLAADQVSVLSGLASPLEKVLVSPVDQDSPLVATAWGYQLDLNSADDPRLIQFIGEFAGSLSAPEPGGACTGGVGVFG